MTQDVPEKGLYFYSALAAFKTRTAYANTDGEPQDQLHHLVSDVLLLVTPRTGIALHPLPLATCHAP